MNSVMLSPMARPLRSRKAIVPGVVLVEDADAVGGRADDGALLALDSRADQDGDLAPHIQARRQTG